MEYGFLVILLVLAIFYLYFARKEYLRESFYGNSCSNNKNKNQYD
jgi:hypothetical protein